MVVAKQSVEMVVECLIVVNSFPALCALGLLGQFKSESSKLQVAEKKKRVLECGL